MVLHVAPSIIIGNSKKLIKHLLRGAYMPSRHHSMLCLVWCFESSFFATWEAKQPSAGGLLGLFWAAGGGGCYPACCECSSHALSSSFIPVWLHPLAPVPVTHVPCAISGSLRGGFLFRCDPVTVTTAFRDACLASGLDGLIVGG